MKFRSRVKKVFNKEWVRLITVAVAAFAIGGALTYGVATKREANSLKNAAKNSQSAQKQIAQDSKQRTETRYKQIQEQLNNDVKNKQLTQKQADSIKKKVDEAYAFRKDLDLTKSEDRKKLQEKRAEWRAWAKENNVSYRYFIWLY